MDRAAKSPYRATMDDPVLAESVKRSALECFHVSRETAERLDMFVELLLRWQRITHLIAPSTAPSLWWRHIGDSLQLLDLVTKPQPAWTWVDLGSGGGFPGLVIGCALAEIDGACVHLIESSTKKAAFLREVARETGAPVIIHAERIEKVGPQLRPVVDVITARALAPLGKLCHLVAPILKNGAQALLMKGQDLEAELTEATRYWNMEFSLVPSRTDPAGRIMIVRSLSPKRPGNVRKP
jgi:16S rRNA (guanine527-N7)-methyltransferase